VSRLTSQERRDSLDAANNLLTMAQASLFAHMDLDDPEPIRPKTEAEITLMEVMIATAQVQLASAHLLNILAEERVR
jgi:hypothetical protein